MRVRSGILCRVPGFFQFGFGARDIPVCHCLLVEVVMEPHVLDHHVEGSDAGCGDARFTEGVGFVRGVFLSPRAGSLPASGH